MNAALVHYSALGAVTDMSRTESYDYVVVIDGTTWHVEVKGTTGDPYEVLLTPREVAHAVEYPDVSLFVLGGIEVSRVRGEIAVGGGTACIFHPWSLDAADLMPLGYKYRLPYPTAKSLSSRVASADR